MDMSDGLRKKAFSKVGGQGAQHLKAHPTFFCPNARGELEQASRPNPLVAWSAALLVLVMCFDGA